MWTLIIVVGLQYYGVGIQQVPDFKTKESCVRMVEFVRERPNTSDAYCIYVEK